MEVINFGDYNETKGCGESISVTQLTSFKSSDILEKAMKYIHFKELSPVIYNITLKGLVNTHGNKYEDVNDINGIAIPAYYQSRITNGSSCSIQEQCMKILKKKVIMSDNEIDKERMNKNKKLLNEIAQIDNSNFSYFLRLAIIHQYAMTGFESKMNQINLYLNHHDSWLNGDDIQKCHHCLDKNLQNSSIIYFEVPVKSVATNLLPQISGQIDVVINKNDTIWELKCTDKIRDEHLLQLGLYAYIYMKMESKRTVTSKILNIKTGQVLELVSTFEDLEKMFHLLVDSYVKGNSMLSCCY